MKDNSCLCLLAWLSIWFKLVGKLKAIRLYESEPSIQLQMLHLSYSKICCIGDRSWAQHKRPSAILAACFVHCNVLAQLYIAIISVWFAFSDIVTAYVMLKSAIVVANVANVPSAGDWLDRAAGDWLDRAGFCCLGQGVIDTLNNSVTFRSSIFLAGCQIYKGKALGELRAWPYNIMWYIMHSNHEIRCYCKHATAVECANSSCAR